MSSLPNTIFLIGLRGSGKTTVGKKLAQTIKYKHVDQDIEFFKKHGPISSFVASNGWNAFYDAQYALLIHLNIEKSVVSTGGSVFIANEDLDIDPVKVSFCKKMGIIVMLAPTEQIDAGARILFDRQKKRNSAKFGKALSPQGYKDFRREYSKKHPLYVVCADEIVYDNTSPGSVVQKILMILKSYDPFVV